MSDRASLSFIVLLAGCSLQIDPEVPFDDGAGESTGGPPAEGTSADDGGPTSDEADAESTEGEGPATTEGTDDGSDDADDGTSEADSGGAECDPDGRGTIYVTRDQTEERRSCQIGVVTQSQRAQADPNGVGKSRTLLKTDRSEERLVVEEITRERLVAFGADIESTSNIGEGRQLHGVANDRNPVLEVS